MPGVEMPGQRPGTLQQVQGLANTAATIASLGKSIKGDGKPTAPDAASPTDPTQTGMSGAINRRIMAGQPQGGAY